MKNTENAWKLKRIANEKGKNAIDTAWKSKPLHGQPSPNQNQKTDVDLHDTYQWLRSPGLKEIFKLIFFIMGLILGVDSVIQAPTLLTTSSQGALFLPQMSIQTHTFVLGSIYTGNSVTIMILKHPTIGMSINRYL